MIPSIQDVPRALMAPSFDVRLALRLADYSAKAYLPGLAKMELGSIANVRLCDGRVLMEDIGDAIVVAFRGTKNIRDWLTDLRVDKKPLVQGPRSKVQGPEVHAGFLAEIDELLPVIIERLNGNCKPLIITGHSLGGALASLAAFTLAKTYAVRCVYTFASPRVGNAAFRAQYNATINVAATLGQKTFRVACAGDLVPLVPGVLDGYRHVGQEIFLQTRRGLCEAWINPNHYAEIGVDMWRAYWAVKREDWDFILQVHSIDEDYIATLQRLQPFVPIPIRGDAAAGTVPTPVPGQAALRTGATMTPKTSLGVHVAATTGTAREDSRPTTDATMNVAATGNKI